MRSETKRSTIYLESSLRSALRLKAAISQKSMSDLVNEAVRRSLQEDAEDLAAFEARVAEASMTYEDLLKDLQAHGKI